MLSNNGFRQGPWKLIAAPNGNKVKTAGAQLHHLADDLGETNNLASQHPDRVKEMSAMLDAIRTQGGSRP